MSSLAELLSQQTRDGDLFTVLPDGRLQCDACGHCCPLPAGAIGVCKVRFNDHGHLRVPWGYVGGVQCDPIEKKPFFHAYPGALAYSFGMLGCDLHCGYCQNWVTSQALRDPAAVAPPLLASPEDLVRDALRQRARVMVSTYNEPLITSEWAVAVFKEAKAAGLVTGYVSNGNGTPQVLEYIRPWVDLYKVDLKSFDDRHYRELGGRLAPILDTIRRLHAMGFWVEIVTLLIPGFNDSRDELLRLTAFIASVSPDIPWHVTAFHGDYKMTGPQNTTAAMLRDAAAIGRGNGLRSRLRRQPTRPGWRPRGHALHRLRRAADRPLRLSHPQLSPDVRRALPGLRRGRSGALERRLRRPDHVASIPFPAYNSSSVMNDTLGRPLRNLRLSVTDRCNLRCEYCMPEEDYVWLPREDVLHFEEISALVDVFLALGVDKIRLTGGEPLLRRDVAALVGMIAAKPGLHDLALTTNGVLLADQIDALKAAGLGRITVSLDTLHRDRFKTLTRFDQLDAVHAGHRRGAPRLRPAEDRHRRHPRRQRRRADSADRVRQDGQRRDPVHRIHGRRRRQPLVARRGSSRAARCSTC